MHEDSVPLKPANHPQLKAIFKGDYFRSLDLEPLNGCPHPRKVSALIREVKNVRVLAGKLAGPQFGVCFWEVSTHALTDLRFRRQSRHSPHHIHRLHQL